MEEEDVVEVPKAAPESRAVPCAVMAVDVEGRC